MHITCIEGHNPRNKYFFSLSIVITFDKSCFNIWTLCLIGTKDEIHINLRDENNILDFMFLIFGLFFCLREPKIMLVGLNLIFRDPTSKTT
jgi:hypothetical protein